MNMRILELKIPPPLVGVLVALAMWGVAAYGPAWSFAQMWSEAPVWRYAVIVVLVATALVFDGFGLLAFRRFRTTINPLAPERSSALVITGIYRVTRNPMYVGMALLLLAWAVYLSAWLPLLGPLVFVLYITRFQILPEERVLQQRFGDAFLNYTTQVRRWL